MFEKKTLRNTQPMDLKIWSNITTDINLVIDQLNTQILVL